MKDRLRHIGIVENVELTGDPRYARWEETRLDRWLVDWLLRYGKEKTAVDIAHEKGIEVSSLFKLTKGASAHFRQSLVDIELFMEIKRIEDALRNNSCSEALLWCNENKAALRKAKVSYLQGGDCPVSDRVEHRVHWSLICDCRSSLSWLGHASARRPSRTHASICIRGKTPTCRRLSRPPLSLRSPPPQRVLPIKSAFVWIPHTTSLLTPPHLASI